MRKLLITILYSCCFFSCTFPKYYFENKAQRTGLDLTQGKWLINDIDCPGSVYKQLTDISNRDFGNFLGDKLFPVYAVRGLILPQKVTFNPTKNIIKEIKKGCVGFEYFINIKAGKIKAQVDGIDLTNHHFKQARETQSYATVEIYDLNLAEIIYSQTVLGTITAPNDNSDVHFSKTSLELLVSTYRKIINDIRKKSIKQQKQQQ